MSWRLALKGAADNFPVVVFEGGCDQIVGVVFSFAKSCRQRRRCRYRHCSHREGVVGVDFDRFSFLFDKRDHAVEARLPKRVSGRPAERFFEVAVSAFEIVFKFAKRVADGWG